jgi:hypothetical protein
MPKSQLGVSLQLLSKDQANADSILNKLSQFEQHIILNSKPSLSLVESLHFLSDYKLLGLPQQMDIKHIYVTLMIRHAQELKNMSDP